MRLAEVVVVAAQAYAECARRGRFGVPPVRAWVLRRIAMQHAPGAAPVEAQEKGREHEKNTRNARGNVIEHIVETRRHPAKVQILRVLVAEHRIHRIRRAIEHSERQPADQIEKERCKNAVNRIFRHGLDRGARHFRHAELFRIAPHDPADFSARFEQIAFLEECAYLHACRCKALRRNHEGEQQSFQRHAHMRQGDKPQKPQDAPCSLVTNDEHDEGEHAAAEQFLLIRIFGTIKAMLEPSDKISHQYDGMEARTRIAENAVDEERKDSRQHPTFSPMISRSLSISRCARTTAARRS